MSHPAITELVLDVLKPHSPSLPEFATYLCDLEYVDVVDISLVEMDEQTDSLKVVIHGEDIDFDGMKDYMGKKGASIHSVDNIVVKVKGE
jgi:hypothetical protein